MASGLLNLLGKAGKQIGKAGFYGGQAASQLGEAGLGAAGKVASKYKDELLIGGTAAAAAGIVGSQLIYDPIDEGKYYKDKSLEILGPKEMEEWRQRPWDSERDPEFINNTIQQLHQKSTDELDTFLVPRSVASEKATDNVLAFLKYAQGKDGAPSMTGIRNQQVTYSDSNKKDQFGHNTIQGQGPSMGNLEMQDVARY